jgi:hypothetical protein
MSRRNVLEELRPTERRRRYTGRRRDPSWEEVKESEIVSNRAKSITAAQTIHPDILAQAPLLITSRFHRNHPSYLLLQIESSTLPETRDKSESGHARLCQLYASNMTLSCRLADKNGASRTFQLQVPNQHAAQAVVAEDALP